MHSTLLSEIVVVISPSKLIDSEFEEWVYWRAGGGGLVPGYYVVTRPEGTPRRLFNEEARFRGPFRSREDAESALARRVPGMRAGSPAAPAPSPTLDDSDIQSAQTGTS